VALQEMQQKRAEMAVAQQRWEAARDSSEGRVIYNPLMEVTLQKTTPTHLVALVDSQGADCPGLVLQNPARCSAQANPAWGAALLPGCARSCAMSRSHITRIKLVEKLTNIWGEAECGQLVAQQPRDCNSPATSLQAARCAKVHYSPTGRVPGGSVSTLLLRSLWGGW
jgi:hypothetical protein